VCSLCVCFICVCIVCVCGLCVSVFVCLCVWCTGAKLEDLESVAKILKGRKVTIRTEVLPAAISIYKKALDKGLIKIFLDAGATVGPPTCGACCGAHMGVLAKGEVCISTTNRNFPGRMGHVESQTYLASPLVVAASAVTGKITDPRDLN